MESPKHHDGQSTTEQKIYAPTSLQRRSEKNFRLRPTDRITEDVVSEELPGLEKTRTAFYTRLAFLKSREIFRDRANNLIRKMKEKGMGRITNDTLEDTARQTKEKVAQKMDELKYMTSLIDREIEDLPPQVNKIIDMAGGAGDLGLAVSMEMFAHNKDLQRTDIVDPVPELAKFNSIIVEELPEKDKFKKVINYKSQTILDAEIPPDSMVVAKHACGDLSDSIIQKWTESKSPLLVIMTCCQDKAQDQPARYGIPQTEWKQLCKSSKKTNSEDPTVFKQGMEAMTKIDQARVDYLRKMGFEAELTQTDKFPKGDVIIARRKV